LDNYLPPPLLPREGKTISTNVTWGENNLRGKREKKENVKFNGTKGNLNAKGGKGHKRCAGSKFWHIPGG
jgi:hypothetical protein